MADPITAFGAAAGAVQLADAALRATREAYTFCSALKHAGEQAQELRDVLHDVTLNVRSLHNYIQELGNFHNASNASESIIPQIIASAVEYFCDDIACIRKLLPSGRSLSLVQRFKLVTERRKLDTVLARLHQRKIDVITALQIMSQRSLIGIRQNMTNMETTIEAARYAINNKQDASITAVRNRMDVISDLVRDGHIDEIHQLQQIRQKAIDLNIAQGELRTQFDSSEAHVSRQLAEIIDETKTSANNQDQLMKQIQQTYKTIGMNQSESTQKLRDISAAVNVANSDIKEHISATFLAVPNVDILTRSFRSEVRSILITEMAPILSRTGQRNESVVSRLEHLVDVMSVQLGQRSTEANIFGVQTEPISVAEQNPDTNTTLIPYFNQRTSHTEGETLTKPYEHQRQTVNIFRQRWRFRMRIGSVAIEVQTTKRRREGNPKGDTSFAICIHFLPDQSIFSLPGLSISWATGPDERGFYHIAPMISIYPILADDHPVWDALEQGDLKCVQDMLANGDVSLRSKDTYGWNLLHYASAWGSLQTCMFLLSVDDSLYQSEPDGWYPVHLVLRNCMLWFFDWGTFILPINLTEMLEALSMFKEKGGDIAEAIDSILYDGNDFGCRDDHDSDIESLTLFMDFLASEHVDDPWRWILRLYYRAVYRPSDRCRDFLRSAIRLGLGPNRHAEKRIITKNIHKKYIYDTRGIPILTEAIRAMGEAKEIEISKEANEIAEEVSQKNDVEVSKDGIEPLPLWCIVSTLIEAGADIYYMDSERFDNPSSWLSIWTPWYWASHYGVEPEWKAALRECGLDPTKVLREDVQRCKQALRLHGATRTGVDEEMLALPSAAGLRCRICRSKYCTEHGTKTFFYGY